MGEGDLHAALGEGAVQALPLGVERVDGDRPERGGGRGLEALVHRLGQHAGRSAEDLLLAGRGGGRAAAVGGGEHVALGHLAVGAGAGDVGELEAFGFGDAPGDRGGAAVTGVDRCRSTAGAASSVSAGVGGRRRTRRRRPPGIISTRAAPIGISWSGSTRSLVISPAVGRRHLGVDLVGRDFDQGLALFDRVADRDVPFEDGAFGDRFAHLGHGHFDRVARRDVGGIGVGRHGAVAGGSESARSRRFVVGSAGGPGGLGLAEVGVALFGRGGLGLLGVGRVAARGVATGRIEFGEDRADGDFVVDFGQQSW